MTRNGVRSFALSGIILTALLGGVFCSKNSIFSLAPYVPVIHFDGYFVDGDQFSWPGNSSYHNRCYMSGDTMMVMYFYSEDYQEGSISSGDQLRLEVFHVDSGGFITTHGVFFHLSRYSTAPTNLTYDVAPADTILKTYSLSMKVESFSFQSGAPVSLTDIGVTPRSTGAGTLPLQITRGTITGSVE
jgi:hypothetical protein